MSDPFPAVPDSRYSGVPRELLLDMKDPGQLPKREGQKLSHLPDAGSWSTPPAEAGACLDLVHQLLKSLWQRGQLPWRPGQVSGWRPKSVGMLKLPLRDDK